MDPATAPPTSPSAGAAPQPPKRQPGEPYCSNCGYSLAGATESARCPECGLPLVDVLTREPRPLMARSRRYRSEATMFGLPIIDIAFGPDPERGELRGKARGIIALGDVAFGGVAVGGSAVGVVSFGGMAVGLFSAGGMSVGVLAAIGGCAVGSGLSWGGAAIGALASGGGAVGVVASGGGAIGYYAQGGGAFGRYVISPARTDREAVEAFGSVSWYLGSVGVGRVSFQPAAVSGTVVVFAGVLICLIALLGHRRYEQRRRDVAIMPGRRP